MKKFFNTSFVNLTENKKFKLYNSNSKALLLISEQDRIFALAFGRGRLLLKPGVWEERFGLKVALSVVDSKNLRSIDKKNMSIIPKLSREQMTKDGTFANFGIDIEQDLIQGITGKSRNNDYGQTVTGKDALGISVKKDISNIKVFLKDCLKKFNSNTYKKDFNWIDHISEVKNPKTIDKLNQKLIQKIKNEEFEKTWMAIPEIVPWEDVSEFKFKTKSFGHDIDLPTYLGFLSKEEKESLSLKIIKTHVVKCLSVTTDDVLFSWKAYNCLCCEIEDDEQICVLSNGKWYQIDSNFANSVTNSFESFKKQPAGITLPNCKNNEHEDKYNERVSNEVNDIYNMDRKTIYHGGTNQKIEFCDLLTKNKQLIHVKHYGSSSVFSHLFSQGLVSGELLLSDQEFRNKLNNKLPDDYKFENCSEKPNPSDYQIIFAIISNSEKDLNIPFFSKVNIRNAKKRLEAFGYTVSLLKITTNTDN